MKGMYSIPYEKRPKQLELIQAAEKFKSEKGVLPTIEELADRIGVNRYCMYERIKKLRACTETEYVRMIDDAERIERSLKSRRGR